jgi:hypothetical protein
MIKQISIATVAVAAITGIAYLAYDRLTCDKDEAEAPEDDSQEAEAPEKDEESTAESSRLDEVFSDLNAYTEECLNSVSRLWRKAPEAPKTTAREELRDELDAIRSANTDLQTKAAEFVSNVPEDLTRSEMGKVVVGLVNGAMAGLDERIETFLASATEYPFDELSDEEVLDVLAEAKEQVEALVQLSKDLDAIIDPVTA